MWAIAIKPLRNWAIEAFALRQWVGQWAIGPLDNWQYMGNLPRNATRVGRNPMLRVDSLHAYVLTCLHAYTLTCVHAYMHVRTCLHAYML